MADRSKSGPSWRREAVQRDDKRWRDSMPTREQASAWKYRNGELKDKMEREY